MKLLFGGAGVLGSLYAARLGEAGHEVSVLARGKRLQEIRSQGIVLEHAFPGKRTVIPVNAVGEEEMFTRIGEYVRTAAWILLVLGLVVHPKSGFLNFEKSANLRYSELTATTRIEE